MGKKIAAALFVLFLAVVCFGTIKLIPVFEGGPRDLEPIPDPAQTVTGFFDSVVSGDFDKVPEYLSNYSSLGVGSMGVGDGISEKLCGCLKKSYAYEIKQKSVSARSADVLVDFTFMPLENIVPDLQKKAETVAFEMKYDGVEIDEEAALKILDDVLTELVGDASKYSVTRSYTLKMNYDGEKWLIELPSELLSAISGIDKASGQEGSDEQR